MVLRAWLIIGLVGIAASQPIQGRQDTRPAEKRQEVTKQTPPTTVSNVAVIVKQEQPTGKKPGENQAADEENADDTKETG
jgi:hypothetical protein